MGTAAFKGSLRASGEAQAAQSYAADTSAVDTLVGTAKTDTALAVTAVGTLDTAVDAAKVATAAAVAAAVNYTTFAAALATLVADGATPTQAHVTAVNSAWGTAGVKAAIDALAALVSTADTAAGTAQTDSDLAVTAVALADTATGTAKTAADALPPSGNITVNIDTASVDTLTKLAKVFRAIAAEALSTGNLTP